MMQKTGLEFLQEQLKLSKQVIGEFDKQMKMFDTAIDEVANNVSEEERQKILQIKAMSNMAFTRAKKGDSTYEDLIDKMKTTFNTQNNGSNSNR